MIRFHCNNLCLHIYDDVLQYNYNNLQGSSRSNHCFFFPNFFILYYAPWFSRFCCWVFWRIFYLPNRFVCAYLTFVRGTWMSSLPINFLPLLKQGFNIDKENLIDSDPTSYNLELLLGEKNPPPHPHLGSGACTALPVPHYRLINWLFSLGSVYLEKFSLCCTICTILCYP